MDEQEIFGLDIIDIFKIISRKRGKFISIMMAELEEEFQKEGFVTNIKSEDVSEFYVAIRKIVLDSFNDFVRSVTRRLIGGDVETGYTPPEENDS